MDKNSSKDKIALIYVLIIGFTYISLRSHFLDDFDSVSFALGIKEFSVELHQPHPPGFPVYIFLGKIFNVFLNDLTASCTAMSALFGCLSVYVFYRLAKEMAGEVTGLISAIITSLTPLFWMNSLKAMTDIPALFLSLLAMFFIFKFIKYNEDKHLYSGMFFTGLSAGLRLHTLGFLAPLLIYSLSLKKQKPIIRTKGILVFLLAIMLWLIPLLYVSGVKTYIHSTKMQANWRVDKPEVSVFGADLTGEYLVNRSYKFLYYFLLSGYGVDLDQMGNIGKPVGKTIISVALLWSLFLFFRIFISKNIHFSNDPLYFFILGLVPYSLIIFLMLPYSNPRYFLIAVPFISFCLTRAIWKINCSKTRYALSGGIILFLAFQSFSLSLELKKLPAPSIQLISFVNKNFTKDSFIVFNNGVKRFSVFYDSPMEKAYQLDCNKVLEGLYDNKPVLLTGPNNCKNKGLGTKHIKTFHRNPKIHIKDNTVELYEFFLTRP